MKSRILEPTTNIVDHAQDLTRAAQSLASDVKAEASSRFDGLKSNASARFSDAKTTASDALEDVKSLIKDYPLAAIGVGVVAGLLLAAFARRR